MTELGSHHGTDPAIWRPDADVSRSRPLARVTQSDVSIMNKFIWLVGAVVIVIAVLSWLGFR